MESNNVLCYKWWLTLFRILIPYHNYIVHYISFCSHDNYSFIIKRISLFSHLPCRSIWVRACAGHLLDEFQSSKFICIELIVVQPRGNAFIRKIVAFGTLNIALFTDHRLYTYRMFRRLIRRLAFPFRKMHLFVTVSSYVWSERWKLH